MRVLVRGAQFNGQARFDTWLFTIARNLVIDQRRKRTMSSLDEIFESNNDEDRGWSFEATDDDPTPFDRLSNLEDGAHCVGTVADRYTSSEVLVLRFHEDLSLEEISKVTRAPLSTVKSRLYREWRPSSRSSRSLLCAGWRRCEQGPNWRGWTGGYGRPR